MHPPRSLRGQRSRAYLLSSVDTVCLEWKGTKVATTKVPSTVHLVCSIAHSSHAIRDTCMYYICTMYVLCMYTYNVCQFGSGSLGPRVPGPGSTEYSIPLLLSHFVFNAN